MARERRLLRAHLCASTRTRGPKRWMLSHAWCTGRCPNKDPRDIKPTERPFLVPHRVFSHSKQHITKCPLLRKYILSTCASQHLECQLQFRVQSCFPHVELQGSSFCCSVEQPSWSPPRCRGTLFLTTNANPFLVVVCILSYTFQLPAPGFWWRAAKPAGFTSASASRNLGQA